MTRRAPGLAGGLLAAGLWVAGLLAAGTARAYFEEADIGVRSVGFGRAYTAIADDASALHWNVAGLTTLPKAELLLVHSRPYGVEGLQSNYLAVALPLGFGTTGLSWHHFGAEEIVSEDLFTLGLGRDVSIGSGATRLAVGGALKLARISFPAYADPESFEQVDYGSETRVTADIGALVRFTNRMSLGAALQNIGSPEFDFVPGEAGGTDLPLLYRIGGAYQWHAESTISLEVQKVDEETTVLNAGGELWFYNAFAIRAGVSSDLGASGGLTIKARRWAFELVALANRPLGASYRAGLKIPFSLGGGNR